MGDQLWRWPAARLADAIKKKDVSSREAVEATLRRIEEVNPAVNAIVSVQADAALEAADAADRAVAAAEPLGALHGVPITTKVNVDQAGLATTNGVVAYAGNVVHFDSPVVRNLRSVGAVIVGRTNTPAFSMRWYTDNELHGRTLNPWVPELTPGGSSGGAAVAVATGMCAVGHGNDGGGSIRYPAFCTGTVGLRASFARIPAFNASTVVERQLSLQLVSVQGAITRNVEDARIVLEAMMQPDPLDPWQAPVPFELPAGQSRRVAVSLDPAGTGIHPHVREHLERVASLLAAAGYGLEYADPPGVAEAAEAWNSFTQGESRLALEEVVMRAGDALSRRAFELMMRRTPILDLSRLMQLTASRATLLRRWQTFMQTYPLVLCPVAMEPALPYRVDLESDESVERLYRSHTWLFATAFLGLPSISVPTGLCNGLPMGVQIIGRRFREDQVLEAAAAVEQACGVLTPIDPRSSRLDDT